MKNISIFIVFACLFLQPCYSSDFKEILNMKLSDKGLNFIKITKDGKYVYTAGKDSMLRKINITQKNVEKSWKLSDSTYSFDIDHEGRFALFALNGPIVEKYDLNYDSSVWKKSIPYTVDINLYKVIRYLDNSGGFAYACSIFSHPWILVFDSTFSLDTVLNKMLSQDPKYNIYSTFLESFYVSDGFICSSYFNFTQMGKYPLMVSILHLMDALNTKVQSLEYYRNDIQSQMPDMGKANTFYIKDISRESNLVAVNNFGILFSTSYIRSIIYQNGVKIWEKKLTDNDHIYDIKFIQRGRSIIYGTGEILSDSTVVSGKIFFYNYINDFIFDSLSLNYSSQKAIELNLLFNLNFGYNLLGVVDELGYLRIYQFGYITSVDENGKSKNNNSSCYFEDSKLYFQKENPHDMGYSIFDIIGNKVEPCSINDIGNNWYMYDLSCLRLGFYICVNYTKERNYIKILK